MKKTISKTEQIVLTIICGVVIVFYLFGVSLTSETEQEFEKVRDVIFLMLAAIFGLFIWALWHFKWSRRFSIFLFLILLVFNYGIWVLNNLVLSK